MRLWKIHFINWTRTDPYFAYFVKAEVKWNVNAADWGFAAETAEGSLMRSKAEMKADCLMFLQTLASYLPDDYLVDTITGKTGELEDVWNEIDKYYGTCLSSFTFLELATMVKNKEETHRQFYMRLEGFVAKHLAKQGVKVEDVETPATGDILTISLKNLVVIMWMTKIHKRLVDFVKIEYAADLKSGKQLIELMPLVADNVDSILSRHDQAATVNHLQMHGGEEIDDDMHSQAAEIRRTEGFQARRNRAPVNNSPRVDMSGLNKFVARPQGKPSNKTDKAGKILHCPKCQYLSEALRLRISTNHEPSECYRRDFQVRQVHADDFDIADDFSESEIAGQCSEI